MKKFFKNKRNIAIVSIIMTLIILYIIFRAKVNDFIKYKVAKKTLPGIVDPDFSLILEKGSKGQEVVLLQERLLNDGADLGDYGPESNGIDGDFGPVTEKALLEIKGVYSITLNGYDESVKAQAQTPTKPLASSMN